MSIGKFFKKDKRGNIRREPPDYKADYKKIGFYNSAYTSDPLMVEVAYHLADAGLVDWTGRTGKAYPLAIVEEVLKVISHPENRKDLLNLVAEINDDPLEGLPLISETIELKTPLFVSKIELMNPGSVASDKWRVTFRPYLSNIGNTLTLEFIGEKPPYELKEPYTLNYSLEPAKFTAVLD